MLTVHMHFHLCVCVCVCVRACTIIEGPEDCASVLADGIEGPIERGHQHHRTTVDVKVLL